MFIENIQTKKSESKKKEPKYPNIPVQKSSPASFRKYLPGIFIHKYRKMRNEKKEGQWQAERLINMGAFRILFHFTLIEEMKNKVKLK